MQKDYLRLKDEGLTEKCFEQLYLYSLGEYWISDIDSYTNPKYKIYNNVDEIKYDLDVIAEITENAKELYNAMGIYAIPLTKCVEFCTRYYGEIKISPKRQDILSFFAQKTYYKSCLAITENIL